MEHAWTMLMSLLLILPAGNCDVATVAAGDHCDAQSGECPPPAARAQDPRPAAKRPNIVMVIVDDLGWNDMGYGGAEYNTTTLDGLAAAGVRLAQHYVQATCSPSRSALMSGRYPFRDGLAHHVIVNGRPFGMPLGVTTLGGALAAAGYAAHAVGKWDLGMHERAYTPTRRGFESFLGHYGAYVDHYTFEVAADNGEHANVRGRDLHVDGEPGVDVAEMMHSTRLYERRAVSVVEAHDFAAARPLFLYLAFSAVHSPLQAPTEDLARCDGVAPDARRRVCAMLQALDDAVASVVAALRAAGAWQDTVFVFSTDNGGQATEGSSNYPLRGNKRTVFEGGVRGTAFVHYAALPAAVRGSTSDALMHLVDWLPTLVEGVAGLPLSALADLQQLDGVNLWPAISSGSPSPRSEVLLNLDPPAGASADEPDGYIGQMALRFENWKLIVGLPNCSVAPMPADAPGGGCPSGWLRPGSPPVLPLPKSSLVWLFDLEADPEETNDLSDTLPGVVNMMREKLDKYPKVAQIRVPFDPKSDPKHFNGYWVPWLD